MSAPFTVPGADRRLGGVEVDQVFVDEARLPWCQFPASRKGLSAPGDAGASVSVRPALDVAVMVRDNTRFSRFAASLPNGRRGPALVPLMAMRADAAGVWRPERSSIHGPVWAGIAGSSG